MPKMSVHEEDLLQIVKNICLIQQLLDFPKKGGVRI